MAGSEVAGKITVTGQVVTKGFADFKAKVDLAIAGATKLASTLDEVITRGGRFVNLMESNTLSIEKARVATAGLVDDFTLLSAANRASALGLGLTSEQFADLSKAATIMSRKLGTEAAGAVNDLITGIGRQSMAILDNLGIIVKAEDAQARFAESIGKTASELTDAEKRTAFQTEAIRKLKEATEGSNDALNKTADNWQRLKTMVTNVTDSLKAWFLQNKTISDRIESFSGMIRFYGAAFRDTTPAIEAHKEAIHKTRVEIAQLMSQMGSSDADVLAAVGLGAAAAALGERPLSKTGPRPVKEEKPFGGGATGGGSNIAAERAAMLAGAESQIAQEIQKTTETQNAKAQAIELNLRLMDMEIAANDNAVAAERQQNEELYRTISLVNELDRARMQVVNSNAQWNDAFTSAAGTVGDFGASLWMAADAAIQSGESFGMVVAKIVKQEMYGVAARATVLALYYTGLGFASLAGFNPVSASQWFTAAGIMAGVAGAAGAAAVGLSYATKPSGAAGGGSRRDRAAQGPGVGRTADSTRKEKQEINVTVYLGDKYDRSAAKWMERKAQAEAA